MGRGLSPQQRRVLALARTNPGRYVTTQQARAELYGWWWARRDSVRKPWQVYTQPKPSQGYDVDKHGLPTPPEERTTAELDASHAATARTLTRLSERGLLKREDRGIYRLTDEGLAIADRLARDSPSPSTPA